VRYLDGERYDGVQASELALQGKVSGCVAYVSKPLLETEDSSPLHADELYVYPQGWN